MTTQNEKLAAKITSIRSAYGDGHPLTLPFEATELDLIVAALSPPAAPVEGLCAAINDLARMLEAVRYTTGLGAKQMERIAAAKKLAAAYGESTNEDSK